MHTFCSQLLVTGYKGKATVSGRLNEEENKL